LTCSVDVAEPVTAARRVAGSSQNSQYDRVALPSVGKPQRFDLRISAMEGFG
jgi:hypothetical protein